jgi:hypothetical protein
MLHERRFLSYTQMGYLRIIAALTLFTAGLASAGPDAVNKRSTDGGVSTLLNKLVEVCL